MKQALPDLLGLPDVPVEVFEHPPLALVLCQISFPNILSVADETIAGRFQRAIQAQYPLATPAGKVELNIPFGAGNAHVQQGRMWHFSDAEDIWKVILSQDFLTLETRQYASISDFLARLSEVIRALEEHISPSIITRLGLRYINEIRPDSLSWQQVIRTELLGPLGNTPFREMIRQDIQHVALQFDGRMGVNIRHGLIPGGTVVQPRAGEEMPTEPFYLLDFDAFREFPLPSGLAVDVGAIREQVTDFNMGIYSLFRWALTDEYISTLGMRGQHAG